MKPQYGIDSNIPIAFIAVMKPPKAWTLAAGFSAVTMAIDIVAERWVNPIQTDDRIVPPLIVMYAHPSQHDSHVLKHTSQLSWDCDILNSKLPLDPQKIEHMAPQHI